MRQGGGQDNERQPDSPPSPFPPRANTLSVDIGGIGMGISTTKDNVTTAFDADAAATAAARLAAAAVEVRLGEVGEEEVERLPTTNRSVHLDSESEATISTAGVGAGAGARFGGEAESMSRPVVAAVVAAMAEVRMRSDTLC